MMWQSGETPAPPVGVLVADHFASDAAYATRRAGGTRDYLLTYTIAGFGRYRIGGGEWSAAPGDVAILLPGAPHDYATGHGGLWEFCWVHALLPPEWGELLALDAALPGLLTAQIAPELRGRFSATFARLIEDQQRGGAVGRGLALNALHELLLLTALGRAAAPHDARVARALALIREQFRSPLTVAGLASAVGLSPSRFAHLFSRQTGVAPLELVIQTRLNHAARLLEFTDLAIGAVADEVGFGSIFAFSRRFAAAYGVSPRAYRTRLMIDN